MHGLTSPPSARIAPWTFDHDDPGADALSAAHANLMRETRIRREGPAPEADRHRAPRRAKAPRRD